MRETQYQKIKDLCADSEFHCQNEFRRLYIFSPHKRRNEIAGKTRENDRATGKYDFVKRHCEHGYKNEFDYKMIENPDYVPPRQLTREEEEKNLLMFATK